LTQDDSRPLAGKRVCIDPGHPSEVGEGTRGRKLTEVGIAWVIAQRVRDLLLARGAAVVLTKKSERQYVRNKERARIANAFRADLMLRLHCDADAGTGIATFFPDRQGTSADGRRGPSREVLAECAAVAPRFHRALIAGLGGALKDKGCKSDIYTAVGGKQGALTGSIYSEVPVVLVEMCVLTNPRDEAFLLSPKGRETLSRALAAAAEAALTPGSGD
jgi:N-acetylmuramoyl-L-alanine amidase